MNRQLQLDAGNTRLKWRLMAGGASVQSGFIHNDADWQIILSLLLKELGALDFIAISTVSGNARLEQLMRILSEATGVEPFIAKTRKSFSGLTVIYKEVERLGVDRWLAMLAAHAHSLDNTKVVVSCGTAITVDVIDGQGNHQGGFIVPGIRLMKKVLAVNTANLGNIEHPAEATALGTVTSECINHGVLAMAVAFINETCLKWPGARLFLTGGDAPLLQTHIKEEIEQVLIEELVLDGLSIASERQ
ncbi:type III pantothenate kinase [Endozoicomonas sp. 8E]|uniref:type III pantothenate kinase n=1 Tax=Endozoicomonas sp. 8E TaxID=3035692 RepID=UPI0029395256|nr:type III pantothenate kinase [Endozoicomonas sp. 8E]WOG27520.1 type III pantothenate kinase [Endozoicomonas sp. 8E]